MASIPYTQNTPVATNSPSQDVNNMTQNTNSVYSIWNIDHKTFSDNLAGEHRQVTMTTQSNPGAPVGQGALYADNVRGDGVAWPVWAYNSGGLQQIEMISFPVTLNAQGVVPLAGKMIMQFGTATINTGVNFVNYNVAFPNEAFVVIANPASLTLLNNNQYYTARVRPSSPADNKASFRLEAGTNIPNGTTFGWVAIGY